VDSPFVVARTEVESRIVAIWREVVGTATVGVRDNFFDLGGHSLMATQVVSRMREAFDVELSLSEFFERPTVAQLAELVENARWILESRLGEGHANQASHDVGEL
jgi:acyl carrier protein